MPELGKTLSQARIARGLTLEDCERDTRISRRYLDALEREEWNVFPAPVYSRAFLRSYAQYLGLNPAELMRLFHAQEEPEFKPLPEVKQPPPTGHVNWWLAAAVLVLIAIAGGVLYLSSRGSSGGAASERLKVAATVTPEAQGGGPPVVGVRPSVTKGEVPDVRSARLEDALAAISEAGMSYVIVETGAAGQPGVVVSQDPSPGTKGSASTAVTVVVPRG
jgi:transcriptional regulator with XRE-family HTH domain